MGKPTICIGENKGADQHRSHYIDSTISLLSKSKTSSLLTIFCDCTAQFVSDLVGTQTVGFSRTGSNALIQRLVFSVQLQPNCDAKNEILDFETERN